MKIKVRTRYYKGVAGDISIFYLDITPCIAFMREKRKFNCEYSLYLSWLAWGVEITIRRDKPIILAK